LSLQRLVVERHSSAVDLFLPAIRHSQRVKAGMEIAFRRRLLNITENLGTGGYQDDSVTFVVVFD